VSLDPVVVVVAVGARARVAVTPASILRPALRLRATEIVLAHNHFAEARPSAADLA
jgi:DNA repair protein RadC